MASSAEIGLPLDDQHSDLTSSVHQSQKLEKAAVCVSCFGYKGRSKNDQDSETIRKTLQISDSAKSVGVAASPQHACSKPVHVERRSLGMHDSMSSLQDRDVDTRPEEEDEDEDELEQIWQIDPHDISFAYRSDGKLCRLGRGSFGTVYKGMWQKRMIAVKVCRQEHKSLRTMRQFQNEVAILNGCSHRNIVEFIGACCWKGGRRTVLATAFMEKGDLCTALGKFPDAFVWNKLGKRVAMDVARGLAFLHSRNVVHFDVKSANILLDRNCCAKLADVGLAQTLTEHRGSQQLSTFLDSGDLGTFAWAAPEVLLGFSCTSQADIFSFGVVLWELATTELPGGRCLRPVRVPEEASREVAQIMESCLRHDPATRPTAAQLLKLLGNVK